MAGSTDPLEYRLRRARPASDGDAFDRTLMRWQLLQPLSERPRIGDYDLLRKLGEGAVGSVYEARNVHTGEVVALKTLRECDRAMLALLKREFRALAGLRHDNLARFHELHVGPEGSFFTMELVRGRDFLSYVWGCASYEVCDPLVPPDLERIRTTLAQVVAGLEVLHDAGKVHRDIKPSNVLVAENGHATVLDFGLICKREQRASLDSTFAGSIVGTPLYMSPEQMDDAPLQPASDWYSVGCMLYHALTGRAPCDALTVAEIRERKAAGPPPPPSEVRPGISDELDHLVRDLLAPDASQRPSGEEIIARLGQRRRTPPRRLPADQPRFLARARELAELDRLLSLSIGGPVLVAVTGTVGVGKSALVQHFIDGLDQTHHVVLKTRCHQQESIPYKVLDGLVDAIASYLRRLPPLAAARVVPRYAHELSQLFPALRRVEVIATVPPRVQGSADRHELRRRAAAALRELLARIADQQPLVVWVDDLQWGDVDSLVLIKQVLGSSEAPPGLFIGTYTGPPDDVGKLLKRILTAADRSGAGLRSARIEVPPLPDSEATLLATSLLPDNSAECAAEIAREASGNPLLIRRLSAYVCSVGEGVRGYTADAFDAMVRRQIAGLEPGPRELLQVIAVAHSPIDQRVAIEAAGVTSGARTALVELSAAGLIRTEGSTERRSVEIDHDRLAQAITTQLDPGQRADLHARLAQALVRHNDNQPQRIALHLRAAGHRAEATLYLRRAAEQACAALAFDRSARLYREVLTFGVADEERAQIEQALGDALSSAGRALEAARAYLRAEVCSGLSDAQRFELKRKAAQELLFSGRYDLAEELVKELLTALDVALPHSRAAAISGLLASRAFLSLRGLGYQPCAQDPLDARDAARADTFWMLGQGLIIIDPIRGTNVLHRGVLASLRSGDPARVSRALALEAASLAWNGAGARPRAERLLRAAREAAEAQDDPRPHAQLATASAVVAFFVGDPARALREARVAEQQLRKHCAGGWELHSCDLTALASLMQLGHFEEFAADCAQALDDALVCGNVFRSVGLRNHTHLAKLVIDDVEGARAEVEAVSRDWPYQGFDMQHLTLVAGPARIALYEGDGVLAYEGMQSLWSRLTRSLMLRAAVLKMEALWLRGRGAALAYAQTRKESYKRAALRDSRALSRLSAFGAFAAGQTIAASVAVSDGRTQHALRLLSKAETAYEHAQAVTLATMVRYQRLRLSSKRAREADDCLRQLREAGIARPTAFVQLHTALPAQEPAT